MAAPTIIPRKQWVPADAPFTGPGIDWGLIHTHVVHFPGTTYSSMDFDRDGVAGDRDDTIRNVIAGHRYYRDHRGYSYGYGHIVGLRGDHAVQARGWDLRNAANVGTKAKTGVSNFNPFSVSTQLLVNINQRASAEQIEAFAWLHVEAEKRAGRQLWLKGHGQVGDTSCPGEIRHQYGELSKAIESMRRQGTPQPPPPPPNPDVGQLVAHGWYKRNRDEWPYGIAQKIYGTAMAWPIIVEDNPTIQTGPAPEWIELRNGVNGVATSTVVTTVRKGDTLSGLIARAFGGADKVDVRDRIGPTCEWSKIANPNLIHPGQVISIPVFWG